MKVGRLTPYLLILPTLLYLIAFFAYPMFNALPLALRGDVTFLNLRSEPIEDATITGTLALQTEVNIVDRMVGEEVLSNGRTRPVYWFFVRAMTVEGVDAEGWVHQKNIFVESRSESLVGRINNGESQKVWTLEFIKLMVNDYRFIRSITNTLLLILIILPIQFILAIVMALVLQTKILGKTFFLYIYAIPLGISDLAAGLVWLSIFTQSGFINSFLEQSGLLQQRFIFIGADRFGWMVTAIVLAELWRATSIVMVIVVSGLQAIPDSYIEAGEVFGATLWQRIWHIILPLLRPSLQVALILRTILAFQVFAVVVAITGGEIFTVMANETYRWYYPEGFNNPNVAAAYSGIIMIMSLGISLFYLRAIRTQEQGY